MVGSFVRSLVHPSPPLAAPGPGRRKGSTRRVGKSPVSCTSNATLTCVCRQGISNLMRLPEIPPRKLQRRGGLAPFT